MIENYVNDIASRSRSAAAALRTVSAELRNVALEKIAQKLIDQTPAILKENALDLEAAKSMDLSDAMMDRLTLTEDRVAGMAQAVREIADFADPLNRTLDSYETKDGLQIEKRSVAIGSILFIYESRPNVTIDGAALCLKSGNAVILRGGKESLKSSKILVDIVREVLTEVGIHVDAVQLIDNPDRQIVNLLLVKDGELDLVIPRGGEGLIRFVAENSRVPVIKHYKGLCHVYIDKNADMEMASNIAMNAKTHRPGVCNAMETILLDKELEMNKTLEVLKAMQKAKVELWADQATADLLGDIVKVHENPYHTEYLDYHLSVCLVDGVDGAIEHIQTYGSGHTEAVVSKDKKIQDRFLASVDSSSVMINASTRFADGGMYGLGAEVGISTDKLHARGPMGVESLTSYKWVVRGEGHVRQ